MPVIAEMIVDAVEDETMIARKTLAAVEAMGVYTGTLKTKVGFVELISSHTCHATVVVLIEAAHCQCLVPMRQHLLYSANSF